MNQASLTRSFVFAIATLLLAACATSKPINEWRKPSFTGEFSHFLVIGATASSDRRGLFENGFVEALAAMNLTAIPSYKLISNTSELSRELVEEVIKEKSLDAVLVTRLVGAKQEEAFRQAGSSGDKENYFGFYDNALKETDAKADLEQSSVLTLETNVYDVVSGQLVWSLQTEVNDKVEQRKFVKAEIELTIRLLHKQGLIQP